MAFIAIDAKADVVGSKKGKLTPAQHAQLNAWCLLDKTGIFKIAGGGQCEAQQNSYSANSDGNAVIRFNGGYIAICGRLVHCEVGTEFVFKLPTSGTQSGKIILRYNLGESQNSEFFITSKTTTLTKEDLNANPTNGIYEFELYSYTATPSEIKLIRSENTPYIEDFKTYLRMLKDYNHFKGTLEDRFTSQSEKNTSLEKDIKDINDELFTINQRLNEVGFNTGSVTGVSGATLTKQGKYAILEIPENAFRYTANEQKTTTLTMSFTSESKIVSYIIFKETASSAVIGNPYEITIEGNKITFTTPKISMSPIIYNRKFNIGFKVK